MKAFCRFIIYLAAVCHCAFQTILLCIVFGVVLCGLAWLVWTFNEWLPIHLLVLPAFELLALLFVAAALSGAAAVWARKRLEREAKEG